MKQQHGLILCTVVTVATWISWNSNHFVDCDSTSVGYTSWILLCAASCGMVLISSCRLQFSPDITWFWTQHALCMKSSCTRVVTILVQLVCRGQEKYPIRPAHLSSVISSHPEIHCGSHLFLFFFFKSIYSSMHPPKRVNSLRTRPSENWKEGLGDRLRWKCTERNVWKL